MNDLIQLFENQIIITVNDRVINIEIDHFKSVRTENGYDNCCELFLQLSQEDNSISTEILYELAIIINVNLLNHNIDWVSTFCVINMGIFNDFLTVSENREETEINVFDNILDAIDENRDVNEELSDVEYRKSFEEGVRLKLIEKEIITE